jgi:hypothetical protein
VHAFRLAQSGHLFHPTEQVNVGAERFGAIERRHGIKGELRV